jgi:hypothetical protein
MSTTIHYFEVYWALDPVDSAAALRDLHLSLATPC